MCFTVAHHQELHQSWVFNVLTCSWLAQSYCFKHSLHPLLKWNGKECLFNPCIKYLPRSRPTFGRVQSWKHASEHTCTKRRALISRRDSCSNCYPEGLLYLLFPNVSLLLSGGSPAVLRGPRGKCQRGVWAHVPDAAAGHRALPDCVDRIQPVALGQSGFQLHHQPRTQEEVLPSLLGTAHLFALSRSPLQFSAGPQARVNSDTLHMQMALKTSNQPQIIQHADPAWAPLPGLKPCCVYYSLALNFIFVPLRPRKGRGHKKPEENDSGTTEQQGSSQSQEHQCLYSNEEMVKSLISAVGVGAVIPIKLCRLMMFLILKGIAVSDCTALPLCPLAVMHYICIGNWG